MECTIPAGRLKIFAKAVQSLATVGQDLSVEAAARGLCIRTVNGARSAFVNLKLSTAFFSSYRFNATIQGKHTSKIFASVMARSFWHIFRNASSKEDRNAEKCILKLTPQADRLTVEIHYRFGVKKAYDLHLDLASPLWVEFERDAEPCTITFFPKLMLEVMGTFIRGADDVRFVTQEDGKALQIKSWVDEKKTGASAMLQTEQEVDAADFQSCTLTEQVDIAFTFKEVKALLNFAEHCGSEVTLNFGTAGQPLVGYVDGPSYAMDMVIATVKEEFDDQSTQGTTRTGRAPANPPHATAASGRSTVETKGNTAAVEVQNLHNNTTVIDTSYVDSAPRYHKTHPPPSRGDHADTNHNDENVPSSHTARSQYASLHMESAQLNGSHVIPPSTGEPSEALDNASARKRLIKDEGDEEETDDTVLRYKNSRFESVPESQQSQTSQAQVGSMDVDVPRSFAAVAETDDEDEDDD
eukprot:Clim_evm65s201 gene=Clim_evmTU65s201